MKMKSLFAGLLLSTIATTGIISCKQSGSAAATNPVSANTATNTEANNHIEFKVGGSRVQTSGWTISRFTYGEDPSHQWLNITSNMHEDQRTININLSGIAVGDYPLSSGGAMKHSHGSFYPDYPGDLSKSYSLSKGVFHLQSIDTVHRVVSGSFSGTVQNLRGESFEITDGKVENGLLNFGVIHY